MIIYNIISLITTLTVILLFFYLRLTKKLGQLDVTPPIATEYYNYFLLLFLCSLSILCYLIILYIISKINKKQSFFDKYKKWLLILAKYNIFFQAYSLIFDYLSPKYTIYLVNYAKNLVNYSKVYTLSLMFIFVMLPRIIIIFILFIDLFILKSLHYYFYSLFLLLIPLFFRFFIFIFTDLSPRLIPVFSKFFDIDVQEPIPDIYHDSIKNLNDSLVIAYKLKPEYEDLGMEHVLYNYYYPLLFLRGHMAVYVQPWYKKMNFSSIILYLIMHILFWGYILFKGFCLL